MLKPERIFAGLYDADPAHPKSKPPLKSEREAVLTVCDRVYAAEQSKTWLSQWHRTTGDEVTQGDLLATLYSDPNDQRPDRRVIRYRSPLTGVLDATFAAPGGYVGPGQLLAKVTFDTQVGRNAEALPDGFTRSGQHRTHLDLTEHSEVNDEFKPGRHTAADLLEHIIQQKKKTFQRAIRTLKDRAERTDRDILKRDKAIKTIRFQLSDTRDAAGELERERYKVTSDFKLEIFTVALMAAMAGLGVAAVILVSSGAPGPGVLMGIVALVAFGLLSKMKNGGLGQWWWSTFRPDDALKLKKLQKQIENLANDEESKAAAVEALRSENERRKRDIEERQKLNGIVV